MKIRKILERGMVSHSLSFLVLFPRWMRNRYQAADILRTLEISVREAVDDCTFHVSEKELKGSVCPILR